MIFGARTGFHPGNPSGPLDFTIRFHLHPGVKATLTRKETRIVIMLPNKTAWQFNARGGTMSLEDSVFLGDAAWPPENPANRHPGFDGNG